MSLISFIPKNILIVRLSAIGDIILASALIKAFHRSFPDTRISWLVDESYAELLKANPRLDKVYVWPRKRWARLLSSGCYLQLFHELKGLIRALRKASFELAIDTQGLLKSGLWAWISHSKMRIGLGSREGSQWLMHKVVSRHSEDPRIGIEYRMLLNALDISDEDYEMDIAVSPEAQSKALELIQSHAIKQPFALICPFTTRPQKHWLDEGWVELSIELMKQKGLSVVMLGGPSDSAKALSICQRSPDIINLVGLTSLAVSAAIIEHAHCLIGVDTGLTHLGIALKKPTIALFGSTRPYLEPCVSYAKVLYDPMPCSPCYRRPVCQGEFNCMRTHTVGKIIKALSEIL